MFSCLEQSSVRAAKRNSGQREDETKPAHDDWISCKNA